MRKTVKGMIREDKNDKYRWFDYEHPAVEKRFAEHMLKGAKKHGSGNWKKGGYELREWLESAQRHLRQKLAELEGIEKTTDEDHLASVRFNINGAMFAEWELQNKKTP